MSEEKVVSTTGSAAKQAVESAIELAVGSDTRTAPQLTPSSSSRLTPSPESKSCRGACVLDRIELARAKGRIPFSVEFFPPKSEEAEFQQWCAAQSFEELGACFASVTYGAGGRHRRRTSALTGRLVRESTMLPLAHLTAVNHTVVELEEILDGFRDQGVTNVLALRGDPPGEPLGIWRKVDGGVRYASQLVRMIAERGDFHIGVASFPGGHFRSQSLEHDTKHTLEKLYAGAQYSITQIFFDVEDYLRLRDRLVSADPKVGSRPIIPSVMPITSLRSIQTMLMLSNARLPEHIERRIAAAAGYQPEANAEAVRAVGVELAAEMCEVLISEGAPAIHFDTLNVVEPVQRVLHALGMAPAWKEESEIS